MKSSGDVAVSTLLTTIFGVCAGLFLDLSASFDKLFIGDHLLDLARRWGADDGTATRQPSHLVQAHS